MYGKQSAVFYGPTSNVTSAWTHIPCGIITETVIKRTTKCVVKNIYDQEVQLNVSAVYESGNNIHE